MNRDRPYTLLLGTAILWAVAFVAWTADTLGVPYALDRSLRRLSLCIGGAMLCLLLGRLLRRIRGRGAWPVGIWTTSGVVFASVLYALGNELALYVIAPHWGAPEWVHIPSVGMMVLWVFLGWVLLYFALDADAQRRDRELRLAQANTAVVDARHKLLLQQLNPHFLFNALNTVYALVLEDDNVRARRSLLALSAFLRNATNNDMPLKVPLTRELATVHDYLEIELTRFGDRLRLVESIPENLLEQTLPPLILQPLVENAIRHGLVGSDRSMTIQLSVTTHARGWMLAVEDDGRGAEGAIDTRGHGNGLAHVRRRLDLLYGKAARLDTGPRAGGGFRACLCFPDASP